MNTFQDTVLFKSEYRVMSIFILGHKFEALKNCRRQMLLFGIHLPRAGSESNRHGQGFQEKKYLEKEEFWGKNILEHLNMEKVKKLPDEILKKGSQKGKKKNRTESQGIDEGNVSRMKC